MAFAKENDWDNRFRVFADLAKSCFPTPYKSFSLSLPPHKASGVFYIKVSCNNPPFIRKNIFRKRPNKEILTSI